MKKVMLTLSVALLSCAASVGFAQDGPVILGPVSSGDFSVFPIAEGQIQPVPNGPIEAVSLYSCVRVKDVDHIHPCAVPLVVKVADPCPAPCGSCCAPKCVSVKICVPPCGCPPKITCRRGGHYVKYDYGRYRIEIRSRKGVVTVDYDN